MGTQTDSWTLTPIPQLYMYKTLIVISLLTYSLNSVSQDLVDKLVSKSCECFNKKISDESGDALREFYTSCLGQDALAGKENEIGKWNRDTTNLSEYIKGYNGVQNLMSEITAQLIINCDKFYEQIKSNIPDEIPFGNTSIYKIGEIDSLTKYIDLNVNLYYNLCYRANAYFKKQNYKKAVKDLNEAIEIDPTKPNAYAIRGVVNFNQKNYEQAYEDYKVSYMISNTNMLLFLMSIAKRKMQE